MKTYDAITTMINDYSSVNDLFGDFIGINVAKDDYDNDFYEAEFEKETLTQWNEKWLADVDNERSFLREITRNEEKGFVVYQRIYMGIGYHRAELLFVFEKEGVNGLAFVYLIDYLDEDVKA